MLVPRWFLFVVCLLLVPPLAGHSQDLWPELTPKLCDVIKDVLWFEKLILISKIWKLRDWKVYFFLSTRFHSISQIFVCQICLKAQWFKICWNRRGSPEPGYEGGKGSSLLPLKAEEREVNFFKYKPAIPCLSHNCHGLAIIIIV